MTARSIEIVIALMIISFFVGRYSAPEKIKIQEKIVTAEAEKFALENQVDTAKTVTKIDKPDGTHFTRTKFVSTAKKTASTEKVKSSELDKKTEITNRSGVTVSLLAGLNLSSLLTAPTYGISVNKPILGPIVVGAWGLMNGSIGLSLGLCL